MSNTTTTSNPPKDNLILRDLYEQYWRCRDFEIKNLWQRSIFLGAFLILCFTGYGAFFGKAFLNQSNNLYFFDESSWKCHSIAMCLTVLGIIFSWLWICLAKASKAWVEVYENAIFAIEKEMTNTNGLKNYVGFQYDALPSYPQGGKPLFDNSIHSTNGGPFSPSRINIFIGQIALFIMQILFYTHLTLGPYQKISNLVIPSFANCDLGMVSILLLLFLLFLFLCSAGSFFIWLLFLGMSTHIKSDTLKEKDPKGKWLGEEETENFYPNEINFLKKLQDYLDKNKLLIKEESLLGSERENVYLAYNYKYSGTKIKIDFFVKKLNLKDVYIEIKAVPFGTILYKDRIKGRKVKSGNQKDILNISREFPLNTIRLRYLIKFFFSKEELDENRLLHDVTVSLQSKSIL